MKLQRPYLGPDNTFEQNRKIRLQEIIDDYLTDDDITPEDFLTELKEVIQLNINYYRNNMNRFSNFMKLVSSPVNYHEIVDYYKHSGR
jgi:hypothetical protein